MTKFWLIILRIICILHLLIAVFNCFFSLIDLIGGDISSLWHVIAFGLISLLPIFTFSILNNNFPDKVIDGKQKKNFNRLFLVNFLLISYLFAYIFRDYRSAVELSREFGNAYPEFFISFISSVIILVFHLAILFGLYWLRNYINTHADRKQFDFEAENENV